MDYDCIIIGGGASGLMLASGLDLRSIGCKGLILEKTSSAGTKLLLSGGGRCNITHGGSIKEFISSYGDAGPRLRKCLYRHSNVALASWLESEGIALADEHGNSISSSMIADTGRIFPASMKASEVLDVLLSRARQNGWELHTESEVYDLKIRDSDISEPDVSSGQRLMCKASPAEKYTARTIVLATGGITFPETGSDGSMFDIIRELGVTVTPLHSSLAPICVEDYPYEGLSGISLSDVTVTISAPASGSDIKSKPASMTDDLLFTHKGFSGPVILNISRYAEPGATLRLRYNKEFSDLPKRMQRSLESRARGPSGDVRTTKLTALLESDEFVVSSVDEHGMVTAGGISLDDVDVSTMMIKLSVTPQNNSRSDSSGAGKTGLYAIGEALDVDGITGGYNLQMCWSTAMTAAESIRYALVRNQSK